jgi:hypothetical protein
MEKAPCEGVEEGKDEHLTVGEKGKDDDGERGVEQGEGEAKVGGAIRVKVAEDDDVLVEVAVMDIVCASGMTTTSMRRDRVTHVGSGPAIARELRY